MVEGIAGETVIKLTREEKGIKEKTSGHIPHPGHLLFAHIVTFFFLVRHVTFWQWTLAARHDCNLNIFCAAPSGHTLACITIGYSNIVSHHIFCFNLCMSPLLSINILTVTFNVSLFHCITLLIRSFCLILTLFSDFLLTLSSFPSIGSADLPYHHLLISDSIGPPTM
jgi:hypothetical protein